MKISKGIGIDLGTTNSAVAIMNLTDTEVILAEDDLGVQTMPSCVWYDHREEQIVVGKYAYRQRGGQLEPIVSIKRWMGTNKTVKLAHLEMTPEEVSAEILCELRSQIEATLLEHMQDVDFIVDRAIITVPAYFTVPAIEATRHAGELAGLEVIELLHEPTAAAIHYSWKHNLTEDCTFMVFDPGGGTFDVSILRRVAGEPQVLGISGDSYLGGDDLDRRLAELIRQRLVRDRYSLDLDVKTDPEDAIRFTRLTLLAEGVKKSLTTDPDVLLRDTNTLMDKNGDRVVIEMPIKRREFEGVISDLIEDKMIPRCWEALAKAYTKAGITLKDIDYILLVGGTSYVPVVQQAALEHFCQAGSAAYTPERIDQMMQWVAEEHRGTVRQLIGLGEHARCEAPTFEDPDTCNALGAAIQASMAGIVIYDDDETIRVLFPGQSATSGREVNIAGQVQIAHSNGDEIRRWLPLDGGRIVAELPEMGFQEEEFLDQDGKFRFRKIPLQRDTVNQLYFEIYGADNQLLIQISRSIQQGSVPDIGNVLTTSVLPRPIRVEGYVNGRIARQVLIPENSTLPQTGHYTFYLQENTGRIVVPLYQGSRLIYEIVQEIDPTLPPGTPIEFTLSIDEKVYIVCKGQIGATEFTVPVDPPNMEVPTEQDVEQKYREFQEAIQYRSVGDAAVLRTRMASILADITESRLSGEQPKIIECFDQMCALISEASTLTAQLEPPKADFDRLVYISLQLAREIASVRPSFNLDETEKNIRIQQQEGDRAAQEMDQQAYSEAFSMIRDYAQGLKQRLDELIHGSVPQAPPLDPVKAARQAVLEFRDQCRQLREFCMIKARELDRLAEETQGRDARAADSLGRQADKARSLDNEVAEVERRITEIEGLLPNDAQQALQSFGMIENDLERIHNILRKLGTPEDGRVIVGLASSRKRGTKRS